MTPAPLPCWQDVAALRGPAPARDEIARPWRLGTERVHWFSRSAHALARLVAWRAGSHQKPVLWLPDYFCNQSSQPARAAGARVRFYPVRSDLSIDWVACRDLVKTAPPDLFVFVHFFGRPLDAAPAADFCRDAGAILIEDAAHVAKPAGAVGTIGDFTFYSPHKVLAVPNGGLLLARTEAADTASFVDPASTDAPPVASWFTKRILQKIAPIALARLHVRLATQAFAEDPQGGAPSSMAALSSAAARLIQRSAARLSAIGIERRRNEQALRENLARHPGTPLFSADWDDAVPYRFAFRAESPDIAARLYHTWRQRGIPVETWPDMALEVLGAAEHHRDAIALRRTVLLLPVHAPVDPARLRLA